MAVLAGIIGCGGIAHNHAHGYIHSGKDVKLAACCDIDIEKAKRFAEEFDIPHFYGSCEEMLAAEELGLVSVCTWNSAHAPCTIAALNAGANVICEKPMAMNAAEARTMEKAAQDNRKLLMVGFVRRQGADARTAKKLIEDGVLGEIYYAKAQYLRRCGFPGGWFGDSSRSGGGPLIDLGVHVIDLARYVMGCPKPVSVYGITDYRLGSRFDLRMASWEAHTKERPVFDVENLALAMIKFDNGATLQVETSFNLNRKDDVGSMEIYGDKAGLNLDNFELYTTYDGLNANVNLLNTGSFHFSNDFDREIAHFIDAAAGETECIAPARDGVVLMEILDAVYASAKSGQVEMMG
ncbi:MAG: Gfo/Idh/MocA family oxidoreductase [Clostridia bacterium]|nr:Gfo/Idh/MocA family oxidoreductase [Clostridia bacterium]